ncbi:AprI/Inh family metalloprotease inhibitor [Labrys monachus]|uniref:Alkaline proteinase inhibitor/ Outer membrane lipoprotein Omp19 domain-containing protein n=1 Tax=Labrys monachus TaxID=217067 RepID=A0ABU0FNG3_9HYPH|nr:AprI/Inh family metalloprotease inhibitor [Labrys monachus]MDQ0396157.1 hypothetical protein [Labrys monachus]
MKLSALAIIPCALALASCESTSRFDGMFGSSPRPVASRPHPVGAPEPLIAAPTEPVSSEPLPPVGGSVAPGSSVAVQPGGMAPSSQNQVALQAPPPPVSTGGIAGSWRISDAARGSCGISLTRQTLLDVYRATPSGCQAGSLAKVNAWQQRGQEIDLLEPGGRTAVRLFPTSDGAYEGAATMSGAKIRMTR